MKIPIGSVLLCGFGSLGALAQAPLSGPLTAPDAAAGWIRLFDGESSFGWKPLQGAGWSIQEESLLATGRDANLLATNTAFGDFELTAEVWTDGRAAASLCLGAAEETMNGLATAPRLRIPLGGREAKRWMPLRLQAEGMRLKATLNGKAVNGFSRRSASLSRVVLAYWGVGQEAGRAGGGDGVVRFRNLRLRPLTLKSIFNGKDLTGWKVLPGHASVFSVTPEGWMNVKNGNGDIQTEGKWGDFVFQMDVLSNGDHLNSGIFYRANAGKFWSGYECQIRNQWQGEDRTKAVDYGTGGLYNRVPARKVVSSDREWFTVTVIAQGLHFAHWVNGYQVVDFDDNGPVNEANAREGARRSAGVLSLQGHDPTTNLSFRNIRIGELGGGASASAGSAATSGDPRLRQMVNEVVERTNQERKQNGLSPLALNEQLVAAAMAHAEDMARQNYFDHTDRQGGGPADRVKRQGYRWSYVGENISFGYASPEAAVRGWMESEGHRKNILNSHYLEIGIGIALGGKNGRTPYWVQVFGSSSR